MADPLGEGAGPDVDDRDAATAADGGGRPPGAPWLGVVLGVAGALGLLAALALTVDRFRLLADPDATLACDLSPFVACGPVMTSRAGALLGFPNPLLGLAGFPVLLVTGALLLGRTALPRWYWRGLQAGVLLAAALITWLQTQSLYVIGALCLWCLLVWTVTIPAVVGVTLHNAAAGHLGVRLTGPGRRLQAYAVTVVAVWYLVVLGAIALRFHRDLALVWFGVAL
ncbi:Uncharacterized membrane protein [Friedmanniella luteola]|uniref:Uncharacterized membrane protein n=1 Tax=Friedmanniella luteola TaxID=546871 RepID=A0A1H1XIF4_9ACTN|nr:vitamin K epoxide reductase family protein [Friedmanniella luteola]SDT08990.1 Uncharacterized membrane protein [Friedmanniella luteola]